MQTMPRRANLTGKLRKDGRWEVRVTLTRVDGAKVVKPLYGKTLLEAQEKAHRLIYDSGRNLPDSFTINELADAWEASFKDSVLKPATLKSYRLMLKGIRQLFGTKEASSLDVPTVVNGLKRIKAPRMRTATRTVLGTMLSYGRLIGAVKTNPIEGLRIPRTHKTQRMRITEDQYRKLQPLLPDVRDVRVSR